MSSDFDSVLCIVSVALSNAGFCCFLSNSIRFYSRVVNLFVGHFDPFMLVWKLC